MNNNSDTDPVVNRWRELDRSFDAAISDHVRLTDDTNDVYFYIEASGFNTLSWLEGMVFETVTEIVPRDEIY